MNGYQCTCNGSDKFFLASVFFGSQFYTAFVIVALSKLNQHCLRPSTQRARQLKKLPPQLLPLPSLLSPDLAQV